MFWNHCKPGRAQSARATGTCSRQEDDLHYYETRLAEEERLARSAGSWEAGLIHDQLAMLYRAQLALLRRMAL